MITDVERVGDAPGDQVGAVRVLNSAFHETLLEFDDEMLSFTYSIDDGPSPVSKSDVESYVGRVQVRPVTEGGGTFVEWSSSWQKDNEPTYEFCHNIYVALLRDMKQHLESRAS